MLEQGPQRQFDVVQVTDASDQPGRQERVTA
jgi:hypothetical protein